MSKRMKIQVSHVVCEANCEHVAAHGKETNLQAILHTAMAIRTKEILACHELPPSDHQINFFTVQEET